MTDLVYESRPGLPFWVDEFSTSDVGCGPENCVMEAGNGRLALLEMPTGRNELPREARCRGAWHPPLHRPILALGTGTKIAHLHFLAGNSSRFLVCTTRLAFDTTLVM